MVWTGRDLRNRVDDERAEQGAEEALHPDQQPRRRLHVSRHHLLLVHVLQRLAERARDGESDAGQRPAAVGRGRSVALRRRGRLCEHRRESDHRHRESDEADTPPHGGSETVAEGELLHQRDEDDPSAAQQHPDRRRDVHETRHHQKHRQEVEDSGEAEHQQRLDRHRRLCVHRRLEGGVVPGLARAQPLGAEVHRQREQHAEEHEPRLEDLRLERKQLAVQALGLELKESL
mmetsp:Transcript_13707/g.40470  ORF Transcript_13707/g.40470 Transcript_13707/m.40470 type:complete len:232 (-) Transcript_13707:121-816(-)